MRADVIRQLIKAHNEYDETGFRKAALQLAAAESKAGHGRIAEQIRQELGRLPRVARPASAGQVVELVQPRGEVADLLEGGYCEERLRDIVLAENLRARLERVLRENRERAALASWGVGANRRLLFAGPPGCGKTLAARVVAGELGMPLMTVRLDGLFSRYLGATAAHLKTIFDEMPRRPAVYFFDEFDSVGKQRGDSQDIGEMRRVVTAFLQLMDADRSDSLVLAATNTEAALDQAIFRRFDGILRFPRPEVPQLARMITLRLAAFSLSNSVVHEAAAMAGGLTFADAARACDDAIRTMVLDQRRALTIDDVMEAFTTLRERRMRGDEPVT